jgi:hypothetical protein
MFAMIAIVLGVYIYGIEKHHYDHMVHEFHENDNQPPERTFYEYNVSPPPTITRTAILRMRMQLTHAARFGIVEHSQEGLPLGRRLQVVLPQRHDQPPQGPLNIFSSCSTNTFLSLTIFTTEASEYQIPFYTSESRVMHGLMSDSRPHPAHMSTLPSQRPHTAHAHTAKRD